MPQKIRDGLENLVYPVQMLANLPGELWDDAEFAFVTHQTLLQENAALKTEVILLKLQQQRFLDLENENRQLRTLLNAAQVLPIKVKVAEVLFVAGSVNSGDWMINQGSREGVYVGQAVLDAQGVLGQVVQVGPKTSRVMLLNNPRSQVPVESVQTGLRSLLQGDGVSQPLTLKFIPKTENIIIGDMLVSSGLGGRFPKGYPVGQITSINDDANNQFMTVNVAPIAALEHQRFVLLVWNDHE